MGEWCCCCCLMLSFMLPFLFCFMFLHHVGVADLLVVIIVVVSCFWCCCCCRRRRRRLLTLLLRGVVPNVMGNVVTFSVSVRFKWSIAPSWTVLREFETLHACGGDAMQKQKRAQQILQGQGRDFYRNPILDNISHFILRLAYCKTWVLVCAARFLPTLFSLH